MTKSEYFTIKGYLDILERSKPNGRYNHSVQNKIMGLRMHLAVDHALPLVYETEIKQLIRALYHEDINS